MCSVSRLNQWFGFFISPSYFSSENMPAKTKSLAMLHITLYCCELTEIMSGKNEVSDHIQIDKNVPESIIFFVYTTTSHCLSVEGRPGNYQDSEILMKHIFKTIIGLIIDQHILFSSHPICLMSLICSYIDIGMIV
jgi:hypothetical protein